MTSIWRDQDDGTKSGAPDGSMRRQAKVCISQDTTMKATVLAIALALTFGAPVISASAAGGHGAGGGVSHSGGGFHDGGLDGGGRFHGGFHDGGVHGGGVPSTHYYAQFRG
jgi:hypothetical protein